MACASSGPAGGQPTRVDSSASEPTLPAPVAPGSAVPVHSITTVCPGSLGAVTSCEAGSDARAAVAANRTQNSSALAQQVFSKVLDIGADTHLSSGHMRARVAALPPSPLFL